MEELKLRLLELPRSALLGLLGAAFIELTISGRASYDQPDVVERLRETNEAIHHLSGHLRDLSSPGEAITDSRVEGIIEQLRILPSSALQRLAAYCVRS
jgi:hypothetical protein